MQDDMTNYRDFTLNDGFKYLPEFVNQLHADNRRFVINVVSLIFKKFIYFNFILNIH